MCLGISRRLGQSNHRRRAAAGALSEGFVTDLGGGHRAAGVGLPVGKIETRTTSHVPRPSFDGGTNLPGRLLQLLHTNIGRWRNAAGQSCTCSDPSWPVCVEMGFRLVL